MDKLNLDINQFLRFLLAGGWAIACYLFINPDFYPKVHEINGVSLTILALVLGSLIYIFHRAVIYPNIYKFLCLILFFLNKTEWNIGLIIPFLPVKEEVKQDFDRWDARGKKDSLSKKNIVEWGSQVHFLYCSAWASLFIILTRDILGSSIPERVCYVKGVFWILLVAGLINNLRLIMYDAEIRELEKNKKQDTQPGNQDGQLPGSLGNAIEKNETVPTCPPRQ